MKINWKELAFAFAVGLVLPWVMVGVFEGASGNHESVNFTHLPGETDATEQNAPLQINVLLENEIKTMEMNVYIAGVLLCELPEQFSLEAKKAQAVVARTYALRVAYLSGKHSGQAVCANPGCCQGYTCISDYRGTEKGIMEAQIAAEDTGNLVLTYNGALIEATYFSCSGGQTEAAIAVWGSDIPYLQSVASPGEESATHYTDTVSFSVAEFRRKLSLSQETAGSTHIENVTYTDGGGVATMEIDGCVFTGVELRTLLGLRSTAFTATVIGDNVILTTRGYGHRVGMSQYGAEAMALSGYSYEDILSHYYNGTNLVPYTAS